jgi:hypothetical protein
MHGDENDDADADEDDDKLDQALNDVPYQKSFSYSGGGGHGRHPANVGV